MGLFRPSFTAENKRGYTAGERPQNRRELVRLILADHFTDLIPCNLVLLAVFLPFLFWVFTGLFYIAGAMGGDGSFADLLSLSRTWVLGMIPCLLFTGPFCTGSALLLRNLARDDCRFARQYFLSGLRSAPGAALAVSAAASTMPLLLWAALAYYGTQLAGGARLALIPLLFTAVLCAIWRMTLPTLYMMLATYRLPLGEQVKNAFALTLSRLPLVAGVHLLALLPALLGVAAFAVGGKVFIAALFVLCVYYLFFGFAFSRLLYAFVANKLCEETLNAQIGADTHIGMR